MQMLSLAEQFLSHYQWTVALTSYQAAIPWPDDVLFNDCVPGFIQPLLCKGKSLRLVPKGPYG